MWKMQILMYSIFAVHIEWIVPWPFDLVPVMRQYAQLHAICLDHSSHGYTSTKWSMSNWWAYQYNALHIR